MGKGTRSHGSVWSRRNFLRAFVGFGEGLSLATRASSQSRSTVVVARAKNLESVWGTPHYQHILELLTAAIRELSGTITDAAARRTYFNINDTLAVQIACSPLAVTPEVVDAVCTTAARAGVPTDRMFIYSADERELYRAGFALKTEGPGVRCYGAKSERYRDWLTALLGPEITAIANVPCLAPHPVVGLAGALHNFVNSVHHHRALEAYADGGDRLGALLSFSTLRNRTRLHVMDCLRPAYDLPAEGPPARWQYNGLLVSTDPVALDAVALALLEAKRREVAGADWPLTPYPTYIHTAAERYELGVSDLSYIDIRHVGSADGALI
ncbi:MAG: DUF362 domain-containing protein [Candidatus Zipacnadales bacterium]